MTDHTLARADEVLTELIELIETARTLPMSSSCVVPRERALDLLDAVREVLPPDLAEARNVLAQRDRTLSDAAAHAAETERLAAENADVILADARAQAQETIEAGRSEQIRLVSAEAVHLRAVEDAAALTREAEEHAARVRADAERYAQAVRADAEQYATGLAQDARGYADRTLADLVEHLQGLAATADNGRRELARRAQPAGVSVGASDGLEPVDFFAEHDLR